MSHNFLKDPLSLLQFRSIFISVWDTRPTLILIYQLCIALKPILCILCHITSYTTPWASFNFDKTSLTYCFLKHLWNKHSQYEARDLLRYNSAPYLPPLYSFKVSIMHFMPYNFLYYPLSVCQFRSIFINVLHFDTASKQKHSQCEAHGLLRYNPAPYNPHLCSFKANVMHFMSYNYLYYPLSLF